MMLGLLLDGPAHGYDLKRAHDDLLPGSKQLAFGQVYATLARLQRDGLIEVATTGKDAGPERSEYAITENGRIELADWLSIPEPAGPYSADDLVRKVVTALATGADVANFLARQRSTHLARMRELLEQQETEKSPAAQAAIDHAVFHLDADLKWLDSAIARLSPQ